MNPNELRIGNLLVRKRSVFTDVPIEGVIFEVNMLNPTDYPKRDFVVYYDTPETGVEDTFRLSECEPTPLTEEWLLRFGFEERKEFNGVGFIIAGFELWKGNGWDYFLYTVVGREEDGINEPSIEIKYVHQLQNLYFALTGEELNLRS